MRPAIRFRAHVGHHPLRLRVLHDGLPGDAFQVIDLGDLPAAGFGVALGSHLVMLGALALGLVFGRDPNPDADGLRLRRRVFYAPWDSSFGASGWGF